MSADQKPRRWFRLAFSLRTLFVAVTLFCVWLGWNLQIVRERQAVRREIEAKFNPMFFSYTGLESLESDPDWAAFPLEDDYEYARVSSIRRLLGDETCIALDVAPTTEPRLIKRMEQAFPEAELSVTSYSLGSMCGIGMTLARRDSLYKPASLRQDNYGTIFQTGLTVASQSKP